MDNTKVVGTLTVGSRLQNGKYEIIKILGQGGFGITYCVRHTLLNTTYALKEFFPQDYCNREGSTSTVSVATVTNVSLVDKLRVRFISEAQNIARLNHPNIIHIHDVFEENGTAYYVMDFIEGDSLEDIAASRSTLSETEAVAIIKPIAEALQDIHERNMTHFDIKPANIMVGRRDAKPVIIDFGLSKQFNEQGHANSTMLMGMSHGYSPIEQYFADGVTTFSPQSDVYSLGATLYRLVAGRVPPEAPRLAGQDIVVPTNISAPVANAIRWAMKSEMSQRCPSMTAFLSALQGSGDATHICPGARTQQQPFAQPAYQPVQPAVNIQAPPRPVDPYLAQPKQGNSNKNLFIGIGIGAVLVIVALVVLALIGGDDEPTTIVDLPVETETVQESVAAADDPMSEEYYMWLSERKLTYSDIADLTSSEMRILRNSIYARHSYKFQSADLQEFFGRMSWYRPLYSDVSYDLSEIEKYNIMFLKNHE